MQLRQYMVLQVEHIVGVRRICSHNGQVYLEGLMSKEDMSIILSRVILGRRGRDDGVDM